LARTALLAETAEPTEEPPPVGRRRSVVRAGYALIGLQLVVWGAVGFRGYFSQDDFLFLGRAAESTVDLDYLLFDFGGHLMPLAFLQVWLIQHVAPLNYDVVMLVNLTYQVAIDLLLFRLLRSLFGPRRLTLVPLALYLFSPLTLPAFMWWAAALNLLPMQLAMVGALNTHLAHLRTGRRRYAVATVVIVGVGLLFFEKVALVVPLLLGLTAFLENGSTGRRLWVTVRAHRLLWATLAAVLAAYGWLYVTHVPSVVRGWTGANALVAMVQNAVGTALAPSIIGGPWRFVDFTFVPAAFAAPPSWAKWLSWEVLLVLAVVSIAARRGAARAWLLLAAYLALDLALLALGRLRIFGPDIGLELRYLTDAMIVVALALALATMPVQGRPAEAGDRWRQWATRMNRRHHVAVFVAAGLVLNLLAVSSFITLHSFSKRWVANPAAPWVANLRADTARLHDVELVDREVSPEIANPFLFPYTEAHRLTRSFPDPPRFPAVFTGRPYVILDDGHLRPAEMAAAAGTFPGPVKNCGWRVQEDAVRMPLVRPLFHWPWFVRVAYLAGADTRATVTFGGVARHVQLRRGLNDLYLTGTSGPDAVTISGVEPGVTVCVDRVELGNARPSDSDVPNR
jgi:hypothetical protein